MFLGKSHQVKCKGRVRKGGHGRTPAWLFLQMLPSDESLLPPLNVSIGFFTAYGAAVAAGGNLIHQKSIIYSTKFTVMSILKMIRTAYIVGGSGVWCTWWLCPSPWGSLGPSEAQAVFRLQREATSLPSLQIIIRSTLYIVDKSLF